MAEQVTDVVTCNDEDGSYVYVSPSVETVLGWRPDELMGQPPAFLWHPEDLARGSDLHAALSVGEMARVEWRARRADGTFVWCESTGRIHRDPVTGRVQT